MLNPWALCTVAELIDELESAQTSTRLVPRLEALINRATNIIEAHTYRRLIYRGTPYVEFHSMPHDLPELYTLDYPIIAITDLREDVWQAHGVDTVLDASAYIVQPGNSEGTSRAKLLRANSTWTGWLSGYRTYRLAYSAGFANRDAVPESIKDVCLSMAAMRWREIERKAQGEMVKTDLSGATMKFMERSLTTAHLTDEMKAQLQPWIREDYMVTGERAA